MLLFKFICLLKLRKCEITRAGVCVFVCVLVIRTVFTFNSGSMYTGESKGTANTKLTINLQFI